ncbi:hypothetical protein C8F01DRAFT_1091382 [Mycena amicta]|nr:hypothetical protein C8F01DRAFT_1091382 [Mycena amicta]
MPAQPPSWKQAHWGWKRPHSRVPAEDIARCRPTGDGIKKVGTDFQPHGRSDASSKSREAAALPGEARGLETCNTWILLRRLPICDGGAVACEEIRATMLRLRQKAAHYRERCGFVVICKAVISLSAMLKNAAVVLARIAHGSWSVEGKCAVAGSNPTAAITRRAAPFFFISVGKIEPESARREVALGCGFVMAAGAVVSNCEGFDSGSGVDFFVVKVGKKAAQRGSIGGINPRESRGQCWGNYCYMGRWAQAVGRDHVQNDFSRLVISIAAILTSSAVVLAPVALDIMVSTSRNYLFDSGQNFARTEWNSFWWMGLSLAQSLSTRREGTRKRRWTLGKQVLRWYWHPLRLIALSQLTPNATTRSIRGQNTPRLEYLDTQAPSLEYPNRRPGPGDKLEPATIAIFFVVKLVKKAAQRGGMGGINPRESREVWDEILKLVTTSHLLKMSRMNVSLRAITRRHLFRHLQLDACRNRLYAIFSDTPCLAGKIVTSIPAQLVPLVRNCHASAVNQKESALVWPTLRTLTALRTLTLQNFRVCSLGLAALCQLPLLTSLTTLRCELSIGPVGPPATRLTLTSLTTTSLAWLQVAEIPMLQELQLEDETSNDVWKVDARRFLNLRSLSTSAVELPVMRRLAFPNLTEYRGVWAVAQQLLAQCELRTICLNLSYCDVELAIDDAFITVKSLNLTVSTASIFSRVVTAFPALTRLTVRLVVHCYAEKEGDLDSLIVPPLVKVIATTPSTVVSLDITIALDVLRDHPELDVDDIAQDLTREYAGDYDLFLEMARGRCGGLREMSVRVEGLVSHLTRRWWPDQGGAWLSEDMCELLDGYLWCLDTKDRRV